jgi:hypothetical protein
MASAELSRRVGRVVGYPPLSEMSNLQCRDSSRRCLIRRGYRSAGMAELLRLSHQRVSQIMRRKR